MDITDILRQPQIAQAIQSLASAYGLTPAQVQSVIDIVIKAFSANIERQTLSRGGIADVMAELARPEHASVLADPTHPAAHAVGNEALATVLGNKAASRNVAAQAAMSTGIEQAIIQKLLPIIASLVMAALSKGMSGGLGDILRKLPGDMTGGAGSNPAPRRPVTPPSESTSEGGLGDILNKIPGFPGSERGTPSTAPAPGPRRAAEPAGSDTPFGGGGLPLPGDRIPGINALGRASPFPDALPDIIRSGHASVDGTPLSGAVRSVLGSLLGFENKGFLGWIFRLIVLRWGWGILQRVLLGRR